LHVEDAVFKRRYALYAVLIVVVVAGAVAILSREVPTNRRYMTGHTAPPPPKEEWKPTEENIKEANAHFSVENKAKGNAPLAGTHTGADWPQFNGANRDNKSAETGLLPRWPKGGPKLLWKSKGTGVGYSTVAVVNGTVYTMGNKGPSEAIIALDAGTGEKIWSTPIAWASRLDAGDGPRGTPTVSRDAVFGLGGNGDLACLDASAGKIRWQKNIHKEFGGSNPGWGTCESVLVDQNRGICTPGGEKATLVALNPETGEVLWKAVAPEKDRAGYASSLVADIDGVRQYVQLTSAGTIGVRADTGDFLWRENSGANGTANCSSPLVSGNFVFSASAYGNGGALVKLSGGKSKTKAELVYKTMDMKSHHGDMVIADGLVFGSSDNIFTCLDLATGKVKWRNHSIGKGSVTYADGRIYLRSESGTVALIEATGSRYHELGRFDQPGRNGSPAWSHPVVAAGKLFLRDEDLLFCYDLKATK
jgi:outer membrane protein assembly factor BamB